MNEYVENIVEILRERNFDFVNKLIELNILDIDMLTKTIVETKDIKLYKDVVININKINCEEIIKLICNSFNPKKFEYLLDIARNNVNICSNEIIQCFLDECNNFDELYELQDIYANDKRIINSIIKKTKNLSYLLASLKLTDYKDEDLINTCIKCVKGINVDSILLLINVNSKYSIKVLNAMVNDYGDKKWLIYMSTGYFNLLRL